MSGKPGSSNKDDPKTPEKKKNIPPPNPVTPGTPTGSSIADGGGKFFLSPIRFDVLKKLIDEFNSQVNDESKVAQQTAAEIQKIVEKLKEHELSTGALKEQIAKLSDKAKEKDKVIADLTEKLLSAKNSAEDVAKLKMGADKVKPLQDEVAALKDQMKNQPYIHEQTLKSLTEQIKKLTDEVARLANTKDILERELMQKQAEITKLKQASECKMCKVIKSHAETELLAKDKEIADWKKKWDIENKEHVELEKGMLAKLDTLIDQQAFFAEKVTQTMKSDDIPLVKNLEGQKKLLEKQVDDLKAAYADLEKRLHDFNEDQQHNLHVAFKKARRDNH